VDYSFTPLKPDKQFKRAIELNAAFTCRLERVPDAAPRARLKNLRTREEQSLSPAEILPALRSASGREG
jgi:histidyl-tRNA synthetase